ncbi:hypothetical protein Tco_1514711 [Tanacetum coccineum]
MTAKQLEDIHNFKQEEDESLYQAWERYNDLLYKCPTHDINSHQKVNIFYKGLSTMNRQLLDSHGPVPGMRPAEALTSIQTMADHSQKWNDGTTSRNIGSSSSNDGLAALVNKLDNLGRDMKKLKESVHAIQVGCQICEGPHLDKDCPLNEEVKQVEEVRYGEYERTTPSKGNNRGRQTLAETSRVTTLAKESVTKIDNNEDCKAIFTNDGAPLYTPFYYSPEEIEYFSANFGFLDDDELKNVTSIPDEIRQSDEYPKFMKDLVANKPLTLGNEDIKINRRCSALLLNQLPPKDKDLGSFILPWSIGRLEFNNDLADLGAGINIMPFSMYKRLGIGKLETIKMNIELADNSKCIPKGIVRNLLIKIDKFILPIDFIILDVLEDFRIPVILGRPLLTTAHAKVDVLKRSISLEVRNKKVIFKLKNDLYGVKNESFLMIQINIITEEDELMNIESDLFTYNTNTCESCLILVVDTDLFTYERKAIGVYYDDNDDFYDPDQCGESRNNEIRERIIHNLHEEWFKGTSDDEDDIEGIIDYLEPTSYDGIQKPRGNFRDQLDSYSFGNFAEIAAVRA